MKMNKNLICALLINATLCLMILLSYSLSDHFELNPDLEGNDNFQSFRVKIKTHKRPINKIVKHNYNRFATRYYWDTEHCNVSLLDDVSNQISSWLILTGSVENQINRLHDIVLASLYPEPLSKIGLPDESQKSNHLSNNYRLHSGVDDQVSGSTRTLYFDYIESYEHSKISTQQIVLEFRGELQTIDYVNRDLTQVWFETKSRAFISENHLVLISWNEVSIQKRNTLQRLRLRDTLERETSVTHKSRRGEVVYRSPTLVFWQPIDSSRGAPDYSDLLECANSFSLVMMIIITTLLVEITKNGLTGHSK